LALTISALMLQGVLMATAAGLSAGITGLSLYLESRGWDAVPPATPAPPKRALPRDVGGRPLKPPTGGTRKPRKRVCSARCRASTKPKDTCNCVCGGSTHGVGKGTPSVGVAGGAG
jgi:hypothetical protein